MLALRLMAAVMVGYMLASILAACGEDQAPTAQPSPVSTQEPTAQPSPASTQEPAAGQALVIDLATATPELIVFAAEPFPPPIDQPTGDLRNDMPALAVGDFNGDGIGDLLVGARFGDGPDNSRKDAGEAYVIFGSATLPSVVDIMDDGQDLTIFGAEAGDGLGFDAAAADVNDDGIDDIIVSAPMSEGPRADYRTDRGETYVIFGRPDLRGAIDIAEGQQDVTITAAEGFSHIGDSLATGDVNADGIADIIMGAPFAGRVPGSPHGGPRTELGEVYVVFGSPALSGSISIPKHEQDFTISGAEQFGELGDTVACGDVNGDGIDDIIAVAEAADGPHGARPNAGEAYVIFGSPSLGGTISIAEGEQDLTVLGVDPQDTLGFSAASGDVNGDGIDDIILVAQRADGPGNARKTAGEAYVILGSSKLGGTVDLAANEQDIIIFGADAYDLLGFCGAGDIDGDGVDDIILGTSFSGGRDNARDDAGEAYVIFGSPGLEASIDLAEERQSIAVYGAEVGDRLGSSLVTGDINGDGINEIILVATHADGPDNARPDAGEIYAIVAVGPGE